MYLLDTACDISVSLFMEQLVSQYEAGEAISFHFLWRSKLRVNLPPKVLWLKKHFNWGLIGGTQLGFT